MIRHIVALRFRDDLPPGEADSCFDELASLQDKIIGALDFRVLKNVSPEEPVVHGFKDVFWFDFTDATARDAYLVHPDHQKAGARLLTACGGLDGIQVLDVEL